MNVETLTGQDCRELLQNGGFPQWVEVVRTQVESINFGTVQIVVHERKVVQIEKTEKIRFEKPRPRVPDLARYS